MAPIGIHHYLYLSAILFFIGAFGVLFRRNLLVILMSIELMLNAVNLSFIAFARHNGTAPLPVWSSNRPRHRLSRTGNRQLNAAIHRIAITQAHYHDPARQLLERRREGGKNKAESLRILKRRLSDVVYRALLADANLTTNPVPLAA